MLRRSLILAAALAVSACSLTAAPEPRALDVTPGAVEAHILFLADDLMEGREAGTRGYGLAANYVEAQFRLIGLEPGGEEGYRAGVPLQTLTALAEHAGLSIDGQAFEMGQDFVVAAHAVHDRSSVEAGAVFAGYGITAPGLGLDDYAGLDMAGQIAVVLAGAPEGLPSDVAAHLNSPLTKAEFAAHAGAAGLIIIPAEGLTRWSFRRMAPMAGRSSMTTAAAAAPESLRVTAYVSDETAGHLFANAPRAFEDVVEAARRGERLEGFALNTALTMSQGTARETIHDDNVVGLLPGSDPALADEAVIVTAHLDHIGVCRPMAEDPICNGALDNASGVSIMIETARALTAGPQLSRPVVFIALAAEEKGLLGAAHIAANPTPAMGRMAANVNLDMPVILYEFEDVIAFGAEHSSLGPVAEAAAASRGVRLSPDPIPEQSLFVRSDHYHFVRAGVPSLFLMTGFSSPDPEHDEGRGFMGFLSGNYHQPGDDLSQPLRFDQGAKFANINLAIIQAIANAPEAPRWNSDSFFAGQR
ncbi:M28 family peptidase [Alkalicaulis satelles]|uniref:M28 family peptidase n=1 Tax=Alkalicaulis satelles TaxID=2609175 RepID=A0A5M6ZF11_9PROT|nr:M28 family peptidase [Alkalicaulis satelles]KAA5801688.1 M28 family peptidase [Alkalicaulis satelles]